MVIVGCPTAVNGVFRPERVSPLGRGAGHRLPGVQRKHQALSNSDKTGNLHKHES